MAAVSASDGEDATDDGAEKRETGEDRPAGGKERKERKSDGKSPLAFARPCRTDGRERTYVRACVRICAGTCNGRGNLPEVHLVVKRPQEGGGG